jgi:peptide/nickel transport system substrate-binding protein
VRLLASLLATAALAVALGLLLFVSRSGGAADFPSQEPQGGRVHPQGDVFRSPTTEPPTINPFTTRDQVAARYVLPFTHDALVDLDPESGRPRPAAAESWSVAADNRSVTFRLRSDLQFADGSPVTRDDLEFTLATARDPRLAPRSQMAFALTDLASAEVLDERTIQLASSEPRAEPALALGADVRLTSRRFFAAATGTTPGTDAFFARLPDVARCGPGTGPYAEQDVVLGTRGWVPGSHLNLVRNPHSWRRAAFPDAWNLAGLQLRFVVEEAARLTAARTGQVDWFLSQSGADVEAMLEADEELSRRFRLHRYDPRHLGHYFVVWNCRRAPLDDARVRRALGRLFDRETIARDVFGGLATPAEGYFKPGMAEYPDRPLMPAFDPARAGAELAAMGFGAGSDPLRIEILCATEVPILRRIAELAAAHCRTAGVELVVRPLEYGTMFAKQADGDFDAVLWIQQHGSVLDPHDYFALGANDMGYDDEELEQTLLAARAASSPADRIAGYHRFQEILAERQPITLLVHPQIAVLVDRRFQDATPGPLGLWPEPFWVPKDRQIVR